MRILFVASAPMEYSGMRKLTKAQRSPALGCDWTRSGQMGGHDILLSANGVGWARAAAAVDAACAAFEADAVVSTGFCGALDPELVIGSVVVGSCVRGSAAFACQPLSSGLPHTRGVVFSVDHVVQTAAEKRALRARGGSVVEMEAAGVASRALARGLPFYCVRAVTDVAGEDLANDFNQALRGDGHFATMRVFRHSLSRPVVRVPELIRLRANCKRAAQTLGDFFADCQF
jgi:adenosylhomocysteine nucleosidase